MGEAVLPESSRTLSAPPLRGSRIGAADPRGVRDEAIEATDPLYQPPSLARPRKGGGDSKQQASCSRRQAFAAAVRLLREAEVETPELDARLLLCRAAGVSQEDLVADPARVLSTDAQTRFGAWIGRRLAGEPVSRILGSREFYGRSFLIDAHTLDPRPDTETLVDAALAVADRLGGGGGRPFRLLDLGTGSGCLLVTLLAELPGATGIGTDVSLPALSLAATNARHLGVDDRAQFIAGDWLEAVGGAFDLIVANPPYLATEEIGRLPREVALHDPRLALDGGADGLDAYRHIARGAAARLAPGGAILLETGPSQAEGVLALLRRAGLQTPAGGSLWRDLAGRARVIGGWA
jgi:release factor glutamine methyltransferase